VGDFSSRRSFLAGLGTAAVSAEPPPPDLDLFFGVFGSDSRTARAAFREIAAAWRDSYAIMLLELLRLHAAIGGPDSAPAREPVWDFLAKRTGQKIGHDLSAWARWCWALPYDPHPRYAEFKALAYAPLDARFRDFFPAGVESRIRLDRIEWGGVKVNGIPPLIYPRTVPAADARYLKDSHVVFGVEADGEARAYPKRILAWHEMARDRVGGVELTIVYCTLCGTVVPYRSETGGRRFAFGTSGLLYESSKLMFDEETRSLWPTLEGRPAVGPLAGSRFELELAPVVTTTWGEWRAEHPETRVLSLDTGHRRDYSEGAAYRDYFASEGLMFEVSRRDARLKLKDEVLVVRLAGKRPLAVAARLLERRPLFEIEHEGVALTIRTSKGGANRVFAGGQRIPAHRAFWFGWFAQFPDTALVK